VENALSAIATASLLGVTLEDSAKAMATYAGIERRMQFIGEVNGIRVIDDFAHNPDKIRAVIQALKTDDNRLIVFWQPHGFGPVKFLKNEFIDSFVKNTNENDLIVMPEIYYAGGSADKSVSAKDLIDEIGKSGRNAQFVPNRANIPNFIKNEAKAGDTVLLLGARDVTLAAFAKDVYDCLKQ
jgi:UDP-N-acetylmuramate--alanine ligase